MGALIALQVLRSQESDQADRAFGWFWMLGGGLWFFSGLRNLALFLGYPNLDLYLFYLVQVFLAAHLIPAGYYLMLRAFTKPIVAYYGSLVIAGLCCAFVIFMFYDGVVETTVTPWASEHQIPDRAFAAFLPVYVFAVVMTSYEVVRRLLGKLLGRALNRRALFCAIALLLYEAAGIFDTRGVLADHNLLLIRGTYMIAALVSFLSFAWSTSSISIVHVHSNEVK
jgi:hypothetical protein